MCIPKHDFLNCLISVILLTFTCFLLSGCWTYICKDCAATFQNREEPVSVTVYPVNVVKGQNIINDSELARELVSFLQRENLAYASLGTKTHAYDYQWGHNQAAMAKRSAQAFKAQVKQDNIQTEYALLVEVLCNQSETLVMGVHYYLVNKEGLAADGGLNNSHWAEFQKVNPKNRNDGLRVAELMLKNNWKSFPGAQGGI